MPSDIYSPCSAVSNMRIPSPGDLLLVWNPQLRARHRSHGRRTPFTTALSDDGRTWRYPRVREDDPSGYYCYTAMYFVAGDPERVLLAYCAGDSGRNELDRLQVTSVDLCWRRLQGVHHVIPTRRLDHAPSRAKIRYGYRGRCGKD